jgi:DNA-binding MarR family transcriptional regulator
MPKNKAFRSHNLNLSTINLILELSKLLKRKINQELKTLNISNGELKILSTIHFLNISEPQIPLMEILKHFKTSEKTLMKNLLLLEKKNFISKVRNNLDYELVSISSEGINFLKTSLTKLEKIEDDFLSKIKKEKINELKSNLINLIEFNSVT